MILSVLPIQTKEEQAAACALCGCEYDIDLLAYKLMDGEETVGVCQFKMTPEGGSVKNLKCTGDVFEHLFMLGRGTLNFMDLCGARYAFLDDPTVDSVIAKAIGFEMADGRYVMDLKDFFISPCCHDDCKHKEEN